MVEINERIMDSDNWPALELPENLELLNELADESFALQTFSGMLASILMYHQLIEAMCVHLLEDCHFLIQLSVYPATIQLSVPKNKMLGIYVNELKETISFTQKEEFLSKVTSFNTIRNEAIHRLRKNNQEKLTEDLKKAKKIFDEIFNLYDEIQDDFRVTFHGYKKDVFADEYGTEG